MVSECGIDYASRSPFVGFACNIIVIVAARLLAWILGSRTYPMADNPLLGYSPLQFHYCSTSSLLASSHALSHVFGSHVQCLNFMEILVADLQPLLAEFQHAQNWVGGARCLKATLKKGSSPQRFPWIEEAAPNTKL